tara:strand:- start:1048 stop:1362 length:315 start_codon:yes stop_codon:yes gene_type:complete
MNEHKYYEIKTLIENIDIKIIPKKNDYYFGQSYFINNTGYNIKDTPLFLFKLKSEIRICGEKLLKEHNLTNNYTLVFIHNNEWYGKFELVNKKIYNDFFNDIIL